jgi:hypothetical protein
MKMYLGILNPRYEWISVADSDNTKSNIYTEIH